MADTNAKMIVNGAYHAGTVGALILVNSYVMKRFLKMKPANLNKFDMEDAVKLMANVLGSTMIRDWLEAQGTIPEDIMTG